MCFKVIEKTHTIRMVDVIEYIINYNYNALYIKSIYWIARFPTYFDSTNPFIFLFNIVIIPTNTQTQKNIKGHKATIIINI